MSAPTAQADAAVLQRATRLFQDSLDTVHRRADHTFAKLMACQYFAGIAVAVWLSPYTWLGAESRVHWHVWAAIFFGGALAGFPIFLAWKQPGAALTRQVIAIAQMLTSALLIHLTGGRIETHFHVFGSLAFLAFYRDWRVLVTATLVVAGDHFARGVYWPQSVFGVLTTSPWRWVEHAGWVVFEDIFLFIFVRQSLDDMWDVATRQAKLEAVKAAIETQVAERTAELADAHKEAEEASARFQFIFGSVPVGISWMIQGRPETRIVNPAVARITGVPGEKCHELELYRLATHPDDRDKKDALEEALRTGTVDHYELEKRYLHLDGKVTWAALTVRLFRDPRTGVTQELSTLVDISAIKAAEAALEKVHRELLEASRRAGMTEVATSVLHNVGNVLNSVNVSATIVADQVRDSKVANLAKVNALLQAHEADLADFLTHQTQGKQIRSYLASLAEHLAAEQAGMLKEMDSLRRNMEHIKEIVTMQQNYSKVYGIAETLPVVDLIEDALRMNAGAFVRHDVELVRDYQDRPTVTLEKHKVLQILVNLMRNAKYACDESGRRDKQMKVSVVNGHERVKIIVSDNGIGIPRENLDRIFAHGFTTRKDGHGYGLHSGALAARDLGGSLTAYSEGHGKGAIFVLELPLKQEGVRHD